MATKKKMFSYDDVIDSDIQAYFDTLPSKKHSAYIRQGLRLLIQLQAQGQPVTAFPVVAAYPGYNPQQTAALEEQKKEVEEVEDDHNYLDIDDDMFGDLGAE